MSRTQLVALLFLMVGCGPSREEQEAASKHSKQLAAADTAQQAAEVGALTKLQGVVETTRAHCAAEFQRVATEKLGPATEGKGCELPSDAVLPFTLNATSPTLDNLPAAMKLRCDSYTKDLEVRVKQTLFKKSGFDNDLLWKELQRTWLVAVVYETFQRPELKTKVVGNADSFVAGKLKGVGYLYNIGAGQLACAGSVDASSSDKVETFKRDEQAMADLEAGTDVAADLAKRAVTSLAAGKTWPLVPNAAPAGGSAR